MRITVIVDENGNGISTAAHGIEGVATAEPAPERFSGFDAEEVVLDATPAPARFQPSHR